MFLRRLLGAARGCALWTPSLLLLSVPSSLSPEPPGPHEGRRSPSQTSWRHQSLRPLQSPDWLLPQSPGGLQGAARPCRAPPGRALGRPRRPPASWSGGFWGVSPGRGQGAPSPRWAMLASAGRVSDGRAHRFRWPSSRAAPSLCSWEAQLSAQGDSRPPSLPERRSPDVGPTLCIKQEAARDRQCRKALPPAFRPRQEKRGAERAKDGGGRPVRSLPKCHWGRWHQAPHASRLREGPSAWPLPVGPLVLGTPWPAWPLGRTGAPPRGRESPGVAHTPQSQLQRQPPGHCPAWEAHPPACCAKGPSPEVLRAQGLRSVPETRQCLPWGALVGGNGARGPSGLLGKVS